MSREKFATQVDSDILLAIRTLARTEGQQLQALVEEALLDLIQKHRKLHLLKSRRLAAGEYGAHHSIIR